jgi:hypothetical protein
MKDTPPYYSFRLTPEKTIELQVQIASGLLAVGHPYTDVETSRVDKAPFSQEIADISNDILRRIQSKIANAVNDSRLRDWFTLPHSFETELSAYKEWKSRQEKSPFLKSNRSEK